MSGLSLNVPPPMFSSPRSPLEPINEGPPGNQWYGTILSIALLPDGKRIITAGHNDRAIRVWNLETMMEEGEPFGGHEFTTQSVSVSKNAAYVVAGGEKNWVALWREDERRMAPRILSGDESSPFHIASVAFNGTMHPLRIASGGNEGVVKVWTVKADMDHTPTTIVIQHEAPRTRITSVQFSPSNPSQIAVTSVSARTISLYDVVSGHKLFELTGHTTPIPSFAWFSGGQRLVSTGDSIRIWDIRAQTQSGEPLFGHGRYVRSVAVSPDGKYMASGSNDGTVRVWNTATREQIGTPIQVQRVSIVRFSLDSKSLITVSRDITVGLQRWPMEHLEVEEGLKLTKQIVDAFIKSSKEFQDDLNERLDDKFEKLCARHTEEINLISDQIDQIDNENQVNLTAMNASLNKEISSFATEQRDGIQGLKKGLTKISQSGENNFKELKESIEAVSAQYREIQSDIQTMKSDMKQLADQFKDLKTIIIQRSTGSGTNPKGASSPWN